MKLEPIRSTRFSPPRRTHVPRAPDVDNGGNKQVLRGPLRLAAALLAGALMISGTAAACEHYTAYPDVVLDSFLHLLRHNLGFSWIRSAGAWQ